MHSDPLPFRAARQLIKSIVMSPHHHDWSVQGFGMLRTYLDADKRWRLNIWHSKAQVPGVSVIHDHPWHFQSLVVSGTFTNIRYVEPRDPSERSMAHLYHRHRILCGPGGGMTKSPIDDVFLVARPPEHYRAGQVYSQKADEVHESVYLDGTVTINDRTRLPDGDHAQVFWPHGEKWVDAEPRDATGAEVDLFCGEARRHLREPTA